MATANETPSAIEAFNKLRSQLGKIPVDVVVLPPRGGMPVPFSEQEKVASHQQKMQLLPILQLIKQFIMAASATSHKEMHAELAVDAVVVDFPAVEALLKDLKYEEIEQLKALAENALHSAEGSSEGAAYKFCATTFVGLCGIALQEKRYAEIKADLNIIIDEKEWASDLRTEQKTLSLLLAGLKAKFSITSPSQLSLSEQERILTNFQGEKSLEEIIAFREAINKLKTLLPKGTEDQGILNDIDKLYAVKVALTRLGIYSLRDIPSTGIAHNDPRLTDISKQVMPMSVKEFDAAMHELSSSCAWMEDSTNTSARKELLTLSSALKSVSLTLNRIRKNVISINQLRDSYGKKIAESNKFLGKTYKDGSGKSRTILNIFPNALLMFLRTIHRVSAWKIKSHLKKTLFPAAKLLGFMNYHQQRLALMQNNLKELSETNIFTLSLFGKLGEYKEKFKQSNHKQEGFAKGLHALIDPMVVAHMTELGNHKATIDELLKFSQKENKKHYRHSSSDTALSLRIITERIVQLLEVRQDLQQHIQCYEEDYRQQQEQINNVRRDITKFARQITPQPNTAGVALQKLWKQLDNTQKADGFKTGFDKNVLAYMQNEDVGVAQLVIAYLVKHKPQYLAQKYSSALAKLEPSPFVSQIEKYLSREARIKWLAGDEVIADRFLQQPIPKQKAEAYFHLWWAIYERRATPSQKNHDESWLVVALRSNANFRVWTFKNKPHLVQKLSPQVKPHAVRPAESMGLFAAAPKLKLGSQPGNRATPPSPVLRLPKGQTTS